MDLEDRAGCFRFLIRDRGTASSPQHSTPSSPPTAQPPSQHRRRAPGQTRSPNDGYAQPHRVHRPPPHHRRTTSAHRPHHVCRALRGTAPPQPGSTSPRRRPEPEYQPSPNALGWPEPEDEVDKAIQLAATGYGPGEAVGEALVGREVAVLVKPGGGVLCAAAPDGEAVVPLFTSPVFLHTAGRLAFELVSADDLIDRAPEGHLLYLIPSAPVSMTLELDALRSAIEAASSPVPSASSAPSVPTVSGDVEQETRATPDTGEPVATDENGTTDETEATDTTDGTDGTDIASVLAGSDSARGRKGEPVVLCLLTQRP
ncbi:type VII secretion system-associated protein [Streptomyces sp. 4503]|uniref:Type VII secretion system-associated protein n=1 Tax=Streptomyces niphimycinicus TaxID=2842201 RepID=A0ABS6CJY0_9ACTN|nr:type VII secretion system-associated protein [Streptomyces niphimycinicus]MBU3867130.1 type VII secretion system-associated protein [Streptomyces niphimycinicus]